MERIQVIEEVRAFNRFYTNVISILDQSVLNSGFSLAEARILFEIKQLQPCTARQLMEIVNIDEGYLSRILHKFSYQDLIAKSQSIDDKRKFELKLSENGMKQLGRLEEIANQSTAQLLNGFSNQELYSLLESMQNINQLLSHKV